MQKQTDQKAILQVSNWFPLYFYFVDQLPAASTSTWFYLKQILVLVIEHRPIY